MKTKSSASRMTGIFRMIFPGSASYWESRYAKGGDSGAGSYGRLSLFKAEILNRFAKDHGIHSVIEFGCGDGHQLSLAEYGDYTGLDVSTTALEICREKFRNDTSKRFVAMADYSGQKADLGLSLDVIFHLVEDSVFDSYMQRLFDSARRYVIIYSSNVDRRSLFSRHVRHRKFSNWVDKNATGWTLLERIPNSFHGKGFGTRNSFADFFIYEKSSGPSL